NEETGELWYRVAQDMEIKDMKLPVGKGIAGYVARTGEIVNLNDVYSDGRFNPEIDKLTGYKTRNMLCVPLYTRDDKIIGVVQVLNKIEGDFNSEDELFLSSVAGSIAVCLDNVRLYEGSREMFFTMTDSFATAIDSRQPVKGGHSERVMKYSVGLAESLGLSQLEIDRIKIAALLHDYGKLELGLDIIGDYEKLPEHTLLTKERLNYINWSFDYKEIPAITSMHHEKFDGSGFPNAITGKAIPLESRIIAISEELDNFVINQSINRTTDEVYKLSVKFLNDNRATFFDPQLVNIFIEKELYKIERRSYKRINQELNLSYTLYEGDNLTDVMKNKKYSHTVNVSAGGLLFKSPEEIQLNKFLEVNLEFPDNVFYVIAKVVRCDKVPFQNHYQIGIKFMNLSHRISMRLNRYLIAM
ncbi:MAG: HD domain-containing phosphohydrolase, partial [Candidatus Hydrogenedentota bacterium]